MQSAPRAGAANAADPSLDLSERRRRHLARAALLIAVCVCLLVGLSHSPSSRADGMQVGPAPTLQTRFFGPFFRNSWWSCSYPGGGSYACWWDYTPQPLGATMCATTNPPSTLHSIVPYDTGPAGQVANTFCSHSENPKFSFDNMVKECQRVPYFPYGAPENFPDQQGWQFGPYDTQLPGDGGRVGGFFSPTCRVTRLWCADGYTRVGAACVPSGEILAKSVGQGRQCRGNPCDPGSGNKYERELDYRGSGPFPLEFERAYNSTVLESYRPNPPALGPQWLHSYDRAVRLDADTATVSRQDGKVFFFVLDGASWVADDDISDRLERLTDGGGNPTGWRYATADGERVETYDVSGKLITIADRAGLTQTLAYSTASTPPAVAPAPDLLIAVADPFGRTIGLTYDEFRRIKTITDPAGGVHTYAYDATSKNFVSVTYPDGRTRTYHYEDPNFKHGLTGITDENGQRYATFGYDSQGRANLTEHAGGAHRTTLTYDPDGSTLVADALGAAQTYVFQTVLGVRRYTTMTGSPCPACGPAAQTFDANGNLASQTDWNGGLTTYQHDLARNLETSRTEASGAPEARTSTTEWHPTWRLPAKVCEPKRITTLAYDAKGNLTSRTVQATSDAQGAQGCAATPVGTARAWTYTYTYGGTNPGVVTQLVVNGPRTDVTDTTTYVYEESTGNLLSVTDAKGHVTSLGNYDAHGKPHEIVDPNDLVTTLAYDDRQRLTSRTVGSETTAYAYDNAGQLTRVTSPDASYVEYVYDAAHRLAEVRDNLGNKVVYTLDAAGNRTREDVYDQGGALVATHAREFNNLSRKVKDIGGTSPATQITQYGYDNQGNLTSTDGPLSGAPNDLTVLAYDALHRLKQVTDALAGLTSYGYDGLDQLASITDPRSNTTTHTVDGLGNLTNQLSPDTGASASTYDAAGNLVSYTDARGKTANYTYDALNRVTSITFNDSTPAITFGYDNTEGSPGGKGRLHYATDSASGTSVFLYDQHGRVRGRVLVIPNMPVLGLIHQYDAFGRKWVTAYPSGKTIVWGYDAAGRPNLLWTSPQPILVAAEYMPFGKLKEGVWGNNLMRVHWFDADGRPWAFGLENGYRALLYDAASRVTNYVHDAGHSALDQQFSYDTLDRLSGWSGFNQSRSFIYDGAGNRTSLTISGNPYAYDVAANSNRLSSTAGPPPARVFNYDLAGNTLGDGQRTFAYDARGRMVQSTSAAGTVTYAVNGLGERVKKSGPSGIVPSGTNYFVYDEAGHLIGEYDATGAPIQEYVWWDDEPVAILKGNAVYYIDTDHLGTTIRIFNQQQQVVWRWDRTPFGDLPPDENPSALGVFTMNLRFPGQYYDVETGLHYNYFRDYDPATGRYVQSDPIGLAGGINTYAYVGGNPLSYVDPTGEWFFFVAGLALGGGSATTTGVAVGSLAVLGGSAYILSQGSKPKETPELSWPSHPPFSQAGGRGRLGSTSDTCKPDFDACREQWIADTKWCDNHSRGAKNFACHRWAEEEFERCKKGQPPQPFRF